MTNKELVMIFSSLFPTRSVTRYWSKGPHAIRVRCNIGVDTIFTYIDKDEWKLETVKVYERQVNSRG